MILLKNNMSLKATIRTTSALVIDFFWIYRLPNGSEVTGSDSINILSASATGNSIVKMLVSNLPDGAELVSFTYATPTASIRRGECFVRIDIFWNTVSSPSRKVISRYVTSNSPVCFPDDISENALSGEGVHTKISGTVAVTSVVSIPSFQNVLWKISKILFEGVNNGSGTKTVKLFFNLSDGFDFYIDDSRSILTGETGRFCYLQNTNRNKLTNQYELTLPFPLNVFQGEVMLDGLTENSGDTDVSDTCSYFIEYEQLFID